MVTCLIKSTYIRVFVVSHADFILEEMKKCREVKSIWREIAEPQGIPYRGFVRNLSKIVGDEGINVFMSKQMRAFAPNFVSENKMEQPRNQGKMIEPPQRKTFQYNAKPNPEELF